MHLTGAQLTVRLLERQGISLVAGIPGGANLPLYDALSQSRAIRHVLTRHEQGAGFLAQGMARATGKTGVCIATSGPGVTNLLTAVADAKLDSVPMVCLTGQVASPLIGTDAFQEVDTYGMSIPITKHNFLARSAEELLFIIPEAFRIAASGRPGPVLVDIPRDVQLQMVDATVLPEPGRADTPLLPDPAEVARAARMINEAERPLLCLGGGVIHAGAGGAALQLARRADMPVAATFMGLGAVPTDDPRYLGMLGMHGARATNYVVAECDCLIVAGARFDDRATGRADSFCRDARVIHVDVDQAELNKIRCADAPLRGDVLATLSALLPLVEERDHAAWIGRVEELKSEHPLVAPGAQDPRTPYGLVACTGDLLDGSEIVVTDVGQHQMRTAQIYPFRRPRQWISSGGLGTMGFGLPAAIGAALAEPGRKVVCFSGDGSLLMNLQELATAAETGANVTIILANNQSLGLVRQLQDMLFEGRRYATSFTCAPDFAAIARGFGIKAFDLSLSHDPLQTLRTALDYPGPVLVNAPVSADAPVYPMVPPGAANTEMIGGERHVRA
ncbi:MAG: acetolactate synthase large subunit [Desulfovibrionaceae bacterium]|jgi:acetolactate synthase-1/2/3 large subunit|nr:acetolactate synthase large subunit [Desulfovibrionaceae bacterium]